MSTLPIRWGVNFVVFREIYMHITSQIQVGRPVAACLPATDTRARALPRESHEPSEGPDKWQILDALTVAAEIYELNHRTLGVLRALISFWPERALPAQPGGAIVFPSNRRLSERLNGMPESTLRRHLARLVTLGLVSRHDSANHKRFARQFGGQIQTAFGFDLSPLALHAEHILRAAETAQEQRTRLMALRDQVAALRQRLIELAGDTDLIDLARRLLRRRPEARTLTELHQALSQEMRRVEADTTPQPSPETPQFAQVSSPEMSSSDDQNERHIQDSDKSYFDSERAGVVDHTNRARRATSRLAENEDLAFADVVRHLTETRSFYPEALRDWDDLQRAADKMAPMLGIDEPVYAQAKQRMGGLVAALSVLCILERCHSIRSPGAYLRSLSQRALLGRFSVVPMLRALGCGGVLA